MKNILLILLLFVTATIVAQPILPIRYRTVKQTYGGDTLTTTLGDTTELNATGPIRINNLIGSVDSLVYATRARVTQQVTDTAKVLRPLIYAKENPLTFSNGLTRTLNDVKLGGTLLGHSNVNLGNYNLVFQSNNGSNYCKFTADVNLNAFTGFENTNTGANAAIGLRFLHPGGAAGIPLQLFQHSTNYGIPNLFVWDKLDGDNYFCARTGKHRFYTNGSFGTMRIQIDDNGLNIGNVDAGTHYTLPQTRATARNQALIDTSSTGTVTWQNVLTDSTSLSNRIDLKLNITDSSTIYETRARALVQLTDTSKVLRPLIYNKWSKDGNTIGTGGNTLGSKDDRDIRIIVNNIEALRIDSLNRAVLINKTTVGTTNPSMLEVQGIAGQSGVMSLYNVGTPTANTTNTLLSFNNANADPSTYRNAFNSYSSRGTFVSPSSLVTGDVLFAQTNTGYINSANRSMTRIQSKASGTISAASYCSNIEFWTVKNASTTMAIQARINDAGQLQTTESIIVQDSSYTRKETSSIADDGTIIPTTGVSGFGSVYCDSSGVIVAWIRFNFNSDGAVIAEASTTRTATTDTDGNLCVFDNGTGIAIKNRTGGRKTLKINIQY